MSDVTCNVPDLSSIAAANALVAPDEKQYDLITVKLRDLMEEGRGECIFEVGNAV